MPTRNVVLTDRQFALIDTLVKDGRYQNASEVLRDGLRLIETREASEAAKLAALREAVASGVRDLDEGRYDEIEEGGVGRYLRGLRKHRGRGEALED